MAGGTPLHGGAPHQGKRRKCERCGGLGKVLTVDPRAELAAVQGEVGEFLEARGVLERHGLEVVKEIWGEVDPEFWECLRVFEGEVAEAAEVMAERREPKAEE